MIASTFVVLCRGRARQRFERRGDEEEDFGEENDEDEDDDDGGEEDLEEFVWANDGDSEDGASESGEETKDFKDVQDIEQMATTEANAVMQYFSSLKKSNGAHDM